MRKLVLAALTAVTAVSAVHGQIVYTDVDDIVFTPGTADSFLDLETGDFATSEGGYDVGFGFSFGLPELLNFSGNPFSDWSLAVNSTLPAQARRFSFGDTLDFSNGSYTWAQGDNDSNDRTWSGSEAGQTFYLALQNPTLSKDAWIALEYDDQGDKLTILSWAVAPSSMNMTAGQTPVPEPAETAAVMALLAAGAAVWRKRRQKVAA